MPIDLTGIEEKQSGIDTTGLVDASPKGIDLSGLIAPEIPQKQVWKTQPSQELTLPSTLDVKQTPDLSGLQEIKGTPIAQGMPTSSKNVFQNVVTSNERGQALLAPETLYKGIPEAVANAATGAIGFGASGLLGIATGLKGMLTGSKDPVGDAKKAGEWLVSTPLFKAYQPTSESGKEISGVVGGIMTAPFMALHDVMKGLKIPDEIIKGLDAGIQFGLAATMVAKPFMPKIPEFAGIKPETWSRLREPVSPFTEEWNASSAIAKYQRGAFQRIADASPETIDALMKHLDQRKGTRPRINVDFKEIPESQLYPESYKIEPKDQAIPLTPEQKAAYFPQAKSSFSEKLAQEMNRTPFTMDTPIGSSTKGAIIVKLANGDASALADVAEGVKQYGGMAMQDEIINGAMGIAIKGKTLDKLNSVEPALRKVLSNSGGDVRAGSLAFGQELPKKVNGVNLTRLDTTYDAAKRITDTAETYYGNIKAKRGPARTYEELNADKQAVADSLGMTADKLVSEVNSRFKDQNKTDAYILAAREEMVRQADALTFAMAKADGSVASNTAVNLAADGLAETIGAVAGAGSKLGRSLNAFKKVAGEGRQLLGDLTPEARQYLVDTGKISPELLARTITAPLISSGKQKFWGLVYSNMMGPSTWAVNIVTNSLWGKFQHGVHAVKATVDLAVTPAQNLINRARGHPELVRPREFYFSELKPDAAAIKLGMQNGIAGALKEITYGIETEPGKFGVDTVNMTSAQRQVAMHPFKHSGNPILQKAAPMLEWGTRFMSAQDLIPRGLARETQYARLALRETLKAGIRGKEAIAEHVANLMVNRDPALLDKADKYSAYVTFTDAPGEFTKAAIQLRNATPGEAGRAIIPFMNTLGNVFKRSNEMLPGVGAFMGRGATGAEVSTVIAKQAIGAGITAYLVSKYLNGELIGQPPKDPAGKDQFIREGKIPNSIKYGDTYISLDRVDVLVPLVVAVTAIGDAITNNPKLEDNEKYTKSITDVISGMINNSYMHTASTVIQDIQSGNTQGLKRAGVNFLTNVAPMSATLKQSSKAIEAIGKGGISAKNPHTAEEMLISQIPFHSQGAPSKYSLWGVPREVQGGPIRQLLPWKISTETKDPVEKEIKRLGLLIGLPSKQINNIALTDQEYDGYIIKAGQPAKQALDTFIQSNAYKSASDLAKAKTIEGIVKAYREKAAAEILKTRSIDQLKLGAASNLKYNPKQQPKTFDELQRQLKIGGYR